MLTWRYAKSRSFERLFCGRLPAGTRNDRLQGGCVNKSGEPGPIPGARRSIVRLSWGHSNEGLWATRTINILFIWSVVKFKSSYELLAMSYEARDGLVVQRGQCPRGCFVVDGFVVGACLQAM